MDLVIVKYKNIFLPNRNNPTNETSIGTRCHFDPISDSDILMQITGINGCRDRLHRNVNLSVCQEDAFNDTETPLQVSVHNQNMITFSQSQYINSIIGVLNEGGRNVWKFFEQDKLFAGW
jgi:hypothetical protein